MRKNLVLLYFTPLTFIQWSTFALFIRHGILTCGCYRIVCMLFLCMVSLFLCKCHFIFVDYFINQRNHLPVVFNLHVFIGLNAVSCGWIHGKILWKMLLFLLVFFLTFETRIAVAFTYIWHHSSGSRKCIRSVLILVYLYSHCCCGVRRRHQIHVMHKTEIIYTLRKWQMRASEREKHAPSTCSQRAFYGIWKPCVWHKLCVTVHWQICCHLNFFFAHLLNIT